MRDENLGKRWLLMQDANHGRWADKFWAVLMSLLPKTSRCSVSPQSKHFSV
jgi:hypothetical protein